MGVSLVKDVLGSVSFFLQDLAPQFKRWAQKDLMSLYNDGQRVIVTFIPTAAARRDAVLLKTGAVQDVRVIQAAGLKPGDGSTPVLTRGINLIGVYRNLGTDGLTPGRPITIADRQMLDAMGDWQSRGGPFVRNYAMDPQFPTMFWVDPSPTTGYPVWVEVGYNAEPPLLDPSADYTASNNATTMWLPDIYRPLLVDYIVARANMIDNDYSDRAKSTEFQQSFVNAVSAIVQAQTGTNPNMQRLKQMSFAQPAAAS